MSVDWHAAVAAAARRGGGFAPLRGYRRLALRLFAGNRTPTPRVYDAALDYELSLVTKQVGTPHREARLVRHGLDISVVPGTVGHALAQQAAAQVIVQALAGLLAQAGCAAGARRPAAA